MTSWLRKCVFVGAAGSLCACTGYQPIPLPETDNLLLSIDELASGGLAKIDIDTSNGLSSLEAAAIAVALNPDLASQRERLDVAEAQLFATRLFPDPQLAASIDRPTGDVAGLVDAGSLAMSYDILALLLRNRAAEVQEFTVDQVRLELIWQEWQVAQQARLLFVRYYQGLQKVALLSEAVRNFEARRAASRRALADGDLTIATAGPDLSAMLDARSQLSQAERQLNQDRHEFGALLGFSPELRVDLEQIGELPDASAFDGPIDVQHVAAVRPDLLALRAGYESQQARVRMAAMRFFPAIGIGVSRARDTGSIYTNGVSVSLDLPIFSGRRGELRVERATRALLQREYLARLAQTKTSLSQLQSEHEIVARHYQELAIAIPELARMADEARRAYRNGDLDALTFLTLEFSAISKRLELIDLEQSLWEISIAFDTISGRPPVGASAP